MTQIEKFDYTDRTAPQGSGVVLHVLDEEWEPLLRLKSNVIQIGELDPNRRNRVRYLTATLYHEGQKVCDEERRNVATAFKIPVTGVSFVSALEGGVYFEGRIAPFYESKYEHFLLDNEPREVFEGGGGPWVENPSPPPNLEVWKKWSARPFTLWIKSGL